MFREAGLWGRRRVFSYPEICGKAIAVRTDVGNHEDVEALCARSLDQFSRIDAWINNAGIGALGRFDQEPVEDHIQVIRTNLHGAVYGSYYALRQFRRQSFGTLINVSSALGKMPAPYYGAYTASKHGMNGLDGVLRQELREDELETIRVCTVMPNSNDTPFFDHAANYTGREPQPIPPLYDPQEVIDTIFDLVIHPKDEVVVGGIGKLMAGMHQVAPGLQERMMEKQVHKKQMEESGPATPTPGALYEPQRAGSGVYGGRLER